MLIQDGEKDKKKIRGMDYGLGGMGKKGSREALKGYGLMGKLYGKSTEVGREGEKKQIL
jgi:hypothetical protein